MTNPNNIVEFITNRVSALSGFLTTPAPSRADLLTILQSGMSAPDHGGLMPWRFKIFNEKNFDELITIAQNAKRADDANVSDDELQKIAQKLRRAPVAVAVWTQKQTQKNIPIAEQASAVSMAVAQQILTATALGYGAVFLTGWLAFNPKLHEYLGLSGDDEFLGFLYLGSFAQKPPKKTRPDVAQFITNFHEI